MTRLAVEQPMYAGRIGSNFKRVTGLQELKVITYDIAIFDW
jgi:hypothetical protein